MFKYIRKIRRKIQFKRNIKEWAKLSRTKTSKCFGVVEVGDITHKVNIGKFSISTKDLILISAKLN